ncbi:FkbM family methyltransferase [Pannus brasiliensis CCIBt3594]|uniref:FkbM family methyltransferase n=1 Tax=Pannus brasiliensis CCIBt3594 TaxID=1427578 RepID=A0AAW9QX17_9CHRO
MNLKSKLKNFVHEFGLDTYKKFSPDFFPAGWDVASDIERICGKQQPKIIFDVGANIGQTATYYREKFPRSDIYCFEPIRETYSILEAKFSRDQRVKCFPIALGASPEKKEIVLNENSQQNSLTDKLNEGRAIGTDENSPKTEIVQIDTLDGFCQENNINEIDLLKIDTEGYELEVLKGASDFLENRKITLVLAEVGFRPSDSRHTPFPALHEHLYGRGFRFYALYDLSYWHPYQYEGLIYCNALFVNAKLVKSRYY